MSLITNSSGIIENSICLKTRRNNDIQNIQCHGISQMNINTIPLWITRIGSDIVRARPSGMYNCHGLVFASRRSVIEKPNEIRKILAEDGYKSIPIDKALPGDVILYISGSDIVHSAILLQGHLDRPKFSLEKTLILSKLGCFSEIIHDFSKNYYEYDTIEVYRVDDDDFGK